MPKKYSRDEVYPYLIQSLHSAKTAEDFFHFRLDNEQLLSTLVEVACHDESDDARMEAAFWISQFSGYLLEAFEEKLKNLSHDNWESVAAHARAALNKIEKMEMRELAS
jgi:DNA primase